MDAIVLEEMPRREAKHQIVPNPCGVPPNEKTQLSSVWPGVLADKLVRLSITALYMRVSSTLPMVLRVSLKFGVVIIVIHLEISLLFMFHCQLVTCVWDKTNQGGQYLKQTNIFLGIVAFR